MNGLVVEEISGNGAIDRLAPGWRRLFDAAVSASPFLAFEWMRAWDRWLGVGGTARLIVARAGSQPVSVLPLWSPRPRRAGMGVRRLAFMGERFVGADGLDLLAEPGEEREAAAAVAGYLAGEGRFDILELRGMPGDSPMLQQLAWRFGDDRRFDFRLAAAELCPRLDLEGGWASVRRQSRRGHEFGRKLRKLEQLDGYEYRASVTPEQASQAVERFLALHERRWEREGGSAATGWPQVKAFHREVAREAARCGLLRFEELWAEGACRASVYGVEHGPRFSFYQCGFDPAWTRQSVGFVALGLSIQGAAERGMRTYDFLRGTEPYKFDWAPAVGSTATVCIARRSARTSLALARDRMAESARLAARAALPEWGMQSLRRLRRGRQAR